MKFKSLAAAAVMAVAATSSFADVGYATFEDGVANFDQLTDPDGTLFGGLDQIVFDGLRFGTYEFSLDFSGQNLNLTSLTLNGQAATMTNSGRFTFGWLENTGATPFLLDIAGSVVTGRTGSYSGSLQVAPVPEPQTYALLLAGLGAVGFVAARRRAR